MLINCAKSAIGTVEAISPITVAKIIVFLTGVSFLLIFENDFGNNPSRPIANNKRVPP